MILEKMPPKSRVGKATTIRPSGLLLGPLAFGNPICLLHESLPILWKKFRCR